MTHQCKVAMNTCDICN